MDLSHGSFSIGRSQRREVSIMKTISHFERLSAKNLWGLFLGIVFLISASVLFAQETQTTQVGPLTIEHGQTSDIQRSQTTDTGTNQAQGSLGATVTRENNGITISGISSSVATVDTQKVTGSASGILRINWGDRNRERSPVTPPGAPELPTPWMFGSGFFLLGFGLLWIRRIW